MPKNHVVFESNRTAPPQGLNAVGEEAEAPACPRWVITSENVESLIKYPPGPPRANSFPSRCVYTAPPAYTTRVSAGTVRSLTQGPEVAGRLRSFGQDGSSTG